MIGSSFGSSLGLWWVWVNPADSVASMKAVLAPATSSERSGALRPEHSVGFQPWTFELACL